MVNKALPAGVSVGSWVVWQLLISLLARNQAANLPPEMGSEQGDREEAAGGPGQEILRGLQAPAPGQAAAGQDTGGEGEDEGPCSARVEFLPVRTPVLRSVSSVLQVQWPEHRARMKWLISQGHRWNCSLSGNVDPVQGKPLWNKKGWFMGLRGEKGWSISVEKLGW